MSPPLARSTSLACSETSAPFRRTFLHLIQLRDRKGSLFCGETYSRREGFFKNVRAARVDEAANSIATPAAMCGIS